MARDSDGAHFYPKSSLDTPCRGCYISSSPRGPSYQEAGKELLIVVSPGQRFLALATGWNRLEIQSSAPQKLL